ncbi:MAG: hypothetical protein L0Y66_16515 [Myxococcaceae bacterium]|nr:hypothetical protein [Myxococcaceae bacterium]MCI0670017.1 hypothetical protein [Myxococcaceae bacterium]
MPSLEIRREESAGAVTLYLSGTFDGSTAAKLTRVLEGLDHRHVRELILDFSQVRAFADVAVAVASQSMLTQTPVRLFGLDHHREQVFRYFGVELPPPAARAYGAAEELPLAG